MADLNQLIWAIFITLKLDAWCKAGNSRRGFSFYLHVLQFELLYLYKAWHKVHFRHEGIALCGIWITCPPPLGVLSFNLSFHPLVGCNKRLGSWGTCTWTWNVTLNLFWNILFHYHVCYLTEKAIFGDKSINQALCPKRNHELPLSLSVHLLLVLILATC